jgi:hypothetical protein
MSCSTMIYRGARVAQSDNVETDGTIPAKSYVYRGIKHNGTRVAKSDTVPAGVYRGVQL